VALFAEMYGFPLTIYLLSGRLQSRFPNVDLLSHDHGHLWSALLGFEGNPHFNPIHKPLVGCPVFALGAPVGRRRSEDDHRPAVGTHPQRPHQLAGRPVSE